MKKNTVAARRKIFALFKITQPWRDEFIAKVPVEFWKYDDDGNPHGLVLHEGKWAMADGFPNFKGYDYPSAAIVREPRDQLHYAGYPPGYR